MGHGSILVDHATHPYAVVAQVRGVEVWSHYRGQATQSRRRGAGSSHRRWRRLAVSHVPAAPAQAHVAVGLITSEGS